MPVRPRSILWCLLVVPSLFSGAAQAAPPRFELTPFVGYRMGGAFDVTSASDTTGDRSVDVDAAASVGLGLGLYRDPNSFYELLYSRQEASLDASDATLRNVDVTVEYMHVGGTAIFPVEETWFAPFVSLTIGATRFEPQVDAYDTETNFSASLGGGLRLPVNENLAVTLGLRGYLTFVDSDTNIFCLSDADGANCLLRTSGSTFFQGEAQLGLTVRF
jgi:opacity protein-like surface antigen